LESAATWFIIGVGYLGERGGKVMRTLILKRVAGSLMPMEKLAQKRVEVMKSELLRTKNLVLVQHRC